MGSICSMENVEDFVKLDMLRIMETVRNVMETSVRNAMFSDLVFNAIVTMFFIKDYV
jgi:hypothetical protein